MIDADGRAELEAERQFLLRSLVDLEAEFAAGDLDDSDYHELKDGYVARAAAVITALGGDRAEVPSTDDDEPQTRRAPVRMPLNRWLVAGAIVAVVAMASVAVTRFASTRLPNDTSSGGITESVPSLMADARALLGSDNVGAIAKFDAVLKTDPDNAEALTYKGWILAGDGNATGDRTKIDEGRVLLERAIAATPDYPDAHAFRGVLAFRMDDDAATAVARFDSFYALTDPPPQFAKLVSDIDAEARASIGLAPRSGGGGSAIALQALVLELCPDSSGDVEASLKIYDAKLAGDPADAAALSCRGWILYRVPSQVEGLDSTLASDFITKGRGFIDQAVAADPSHLGSRLLRGIAGIIDGVEPNTVLVDFDAYYAVPDRPARLDELAAGFDNDAHRAAGIPMRIDGATPSATAVSVGPATTQSSSVTSGP